MPPHDAHALLSAAEVGIERKRDERVDKAERIVDEHRAAICCGDLCTIGRDERGKEAEERDGRVVGDERDDLQKAVRHVLQDFCRQAVRAAAQIDAKADEDGEDDERQHRAAGQQRREILDREEVDEQLCDARLFIDRARRRVRPRLEDRGIEAHRKEHDDCGDKARDDEDQKRRAHDLPRALRAFHAGDGATQRAEHERHDDAEHQVNEDRAERGETRRPRPQRAQHASEYDGEQHRAQKAVGAEKGTRHRIPPLKIAFNTI